MRETKLDAHVRTALKLDAEEYAEVVWAAVHTLLHFGRVYVWPVEHLENDLRLGSEALKKLRANPEIPKAKIKSWERELEARLAMLKPTAPKATTKAAARTVTKAQKPDAPRLELEHLWCVDLIEAKKRTVAHEQMPFDSRHGVVLQLEQIDNNRLLVVSGEWLAVLDLATGKPIWRQDAIERNTFLRDIFVATDKHFVVSGPGAQTTLRDLETGETIKQFKHPAFTSAALSADGARLIVMTFDQTLEVYDLPTKKRLFTVSHNLAGPKDTGHCSISSDGKFATSRWQQSLAIWDLERGAQIGKVGGVRASRFTRDRQYLLCTKSDGGVIFDLSMGKLSRKLTKAELRIGEHSPDGRLEVKVKQQRFDYFVEGVTALDSKSPLLQSSKRWLDDTHLVLPYVNKKETRDVGLRIWNIDPLEVVSEFRIDAQLIAKACDSPSYQNCPDITRIIVDRQNLKVYVGDQDHHIHAFRVCVGGKT